MYGMDEWYYYMDGEDLHRVKVESDDYPMNPRESNDSDIGTMVCQHRHYIFGSEDKDFNGNIVEYLRSEVRGTYEEYEMIQYIKCNKTEADMEIVYDEEDEMYQLIGNYYNYASKTTDRCIYGMAECEDDLYDDITENLEIGDMLAMLDNRDYIFLPLAIYDHSGVTMWVGSKWSHFDAQWDCSNVGFIYTTKAKVLETCGGYTDVKGNFIKCTENNWKDVAVHDMTEEIKIYDMYLTGECYGFIEEKYAGDDEWDEVDSCWGYFTDKINEELVREVSKVKESFISEYDAEEAMNEYDIMMQADMCVID
jgi:hypothetical protein